MKKLLLPTLLTLATTTSFAAIEKPNVIIFLVDDMGLMDTSLPFITDNKGKVIETPLNDWYRTPNMERMAEQGVRFSKFYAQSVSSPSRSSIITGQNSTRHGITQWIMSERNNKGTFGPDNWNWEGLKKDTQTLPRLFAKNGYKSIHVGKAHFGAEAYEGADPMNIGFEVNIGGSSIGQPGSYYGSWGYGNIKGNKERAVQGLEKYYDSDTFLTEALTIEANEQIDKAVAEDKPFFLYMAHYAVHAPFEADPRFKDNYDPKKGDNKQIAFATLIEGMDKSLGDIMDHLEDKGIAENTLILFMGDNGSDAPFFPWKGYGASAPLRGKKGTEYEGGVRVPFIAAWGKPCSDNKFQQKLPIKQNCVQTQLGTIMDIFPTVINLAGITPDNKDVLDGYDLSKMFKGEKDSAHPNVVLMHFPHEHRGSYYTTYRNSDFKLIYHYNPEYPSMPMCELYDLAKDPGECDNLAYTNGKKLSEMIVLMSKQLEKEGALYPEDKNGNPIKPVVPQF